MALDSVPWAVGGGAQLGPEIARTLAYAATGGAEGVTASTDLRVLSLATPGASVRVMPGSATILNRYAGASQQSYMARAASETNVAVAATTSAGGRSDMLVLRIDDPQYGGTAPSDPKVGPYVRFAIVQGVGSTATTVTGLTYPAIALARIDIPVSTATITQAMIVDVRKVARPQRTRDLYNTQPSVTTTVSNSTYKDIAPQAARSLAIPSWATQMKVIGHVAGAIVSGGDFNGNIGAVIGGTALSANALNQDAYTRTPAMVSDTWAIPAATRGTTQTLYLRANKSSGTGTFGTDSYTTVIWDVEFLEAASSD